jgi:hypothetical protein
LFVTSASGQRAVVIGPGVVCSRDANGYSGRGVPKHVIAVLRVNRRPGVGGAVERAGAIEPAIEGASVDGIKVGGIGSGVVNGKRRQLTRQRCARASAQQQGTGIFRGGDASGLVATSIF